MECLLIQVNGSKDRRSELVDGVGVQEIICISPLIMSPFSEFLFLFHVAVVISYLNLHCFTGNLVRYGSWCVNH